MGLKDGWWLKATNKNRLISSSTPVTEGQSLGNLELYWTVEKVQRFWWVSWCQILKKNKQKKYVGKPSRQVSRYWRRITYISACRNLVQKIISSKCHIYESTTGRYYMILGREIITTLGLNIKFSRKIFVFGKGTYEGCSEPMVDVINYCWE